MTDNKEQNTEEQRAFGESFANFKRKTHRANALKRCDETARRGTGMGVCDTLLDEHGNCPNARGHLS